MKEFINICNSLEIYVTGSKPISGVNYEGTWSTNCKLDGLNCIRHVAIINGTSWQKKRALIGSDVQNEWGNSIINVLINLAEEKNCKKFPIWLHQKINKKYWMPPSFPFKTTLCQFSSSVWNAVICLLNVQWNLCHQKGRGLQWKSCH